MKTKLIALLLVMIFLAAHTVKAESKVLLRFNFQKGSIYEMTMNMLSDINQEMMGQQMDILQKLEMVSTYEVLDVLPGNEFLIEYSFQKMKINTTVNGQETGMDSESTDNDPKNDFLKNLSLIKVKVKMDSKGKVLEVEGMEEYVNKMTGNPQLTQSIPMFTNENNFKSFVEQTFGYLPETEVEVGSKWNTSIKTPAFMDMEVVMNFEVANILDDQVILNVTSDINMETPMDMNGVKMNIKMAGSQTGTMALNLNNCIEGSSDMVMKYDANIKMKNPQSGEDMEIPMIMNSVIKSSIVKK